MSITINGETYTTFSDYMNDETKVSKSEKAKIEKELTYIFQKKSMLGAGVGLANLPSMQEMEEIDEEVLSDFEEELL